MRALAESFTQAAQNVTVGLKKEPPAEANPKMFEIIVLRIRNR